MAQRQRRPCNVLYDCFIDPTSSAPEDGASPTTSVATPAASAARGAFWDWWSEQNSADGIDADGHDPRINYERRIVLVQEQFGDDAADALRSWIQQNPQSAMTPPAAPLATPLPEPADTSQPVEGVATEGRVHREGELDRWRAPRVETPRPPARVRWMENKAWTSPARSTKAPIIVAPLPFPGSSTPAENEPEPGAETDVQTTAFDTPVGLTESPPTAAGFPAPITLDQPPMDPPPITEPVTGVDPPVTDPVDFETPIRVLHPEPFTMPPGTTAVGPETAAERSETDALVQTARTSLAGPGTMPAADATPSPESPAANERMGNLLISLGVLILVGLFVVLLLF